MKAKKFLITILFGALFIGAPFASAHSGESPHDEPPVEGSNYLECGHCTGNPEDNETGGCGQGGCDINVAEQLKYMPYYGIPELAASTPISHWFGMAFLAFLALIIILI